LGAEGLQPGELFATFYRVEERLDESSHSVVYRALRLSDGLPVALRVLRAGRRASQKQLKRFEREALLLGRIEHPNVVGLLDYGFADGLPFIVVEALDGHSLAFLVQHEGVLALQLIARVARQVLGALEAIHALGVAHRDICPTTIFLCAGPVERMVRLVDFGLVKGLSGNGAESARLTGTGELIGTAAYVSPEQVRGRDISARSDIYSLGLVMAECLTGQAVVQGPDDLRKVMQHMAVEEHVLGAEVMGSPLGFVVARAVRKHADDRYASADAMREDVERALAAYEARQSQTDATRQSWPGGDVNSREELRSKLRELKHTEDMAPPSKKMRERLANLKSTEDMPPSKPPIEPHSPRIDTTDPFAPFRTTVPADDESKGKG
jgi:serine/threonine protein kinase